MGKHGERGLRGRGEEGARGGAEGWWGQWASESPLLTCWHACAWLGRPPKSGADRDRSLGESPPGLISGLSISRLLAQGGEEGGEGGHEGGGRRADRAGGWPRLHRAMADADGAIPEPELPAAAGRSTRGERLGPAVVSVSHERELAFSCDPRLFRHCKQRGAVRARVHARARARLL